MVFGLVLAYVLVRSLTFLFVTARWEVIVDGPLVFYMVGNDFAKTGISYEMLWAGIYVAVFATALAVGLAYRPDLPPMRRGARAAMIGGPVFGIGLILSMTRTITPTLLTLGGGGGGPRRVAGGTSPATRGAAAVRCGCSSRWRCCRSGSSPTSSRATSTTSAGSS